MTLLYIAVLTMSVTASVVTLAVMLVRIPLKKAPKIFSYAIWGVVLFRLVCPFSIESQFSFIPFNQSSIYWYSSGFENGQPSIVEDNVSFVSALKAAYWAVGDAFNGGMGSISVTTDSVPEGYKNAFHSEVWLIFGSYIWLFGFIALLLYAIIGYIRLKRRVYYATLVKGNIYESDKIKTPFVLGFIHPKIYLPIAIDPTQHDYIVKHEQTHIRRHDYIIKPCAFIVFALHWFNPLMWVAYILMSKDIEMSCDEAVLKKTDVDIRGEYSSSLLSLSVKRGGLLLTPLAFGESGVRERVKNVLNFKKPSRIIVIVAMVIVAVLSIGFAANRTNANDELDNGDLRRHDMPESVSIYNSVGESYHDITNDIPILVIEDNNGIKLFYDMIKNSEKLPGILDVMASPYVATLRFGSTVEVIDLYLSFPNEHGRIAYEGMYINHKESHFGFKFQKDDVEAFLQKYETELYDVFIEYLNGDNVLDESPVAINGIITDNAAVLSTYITDGGLSRLVLLENNRFSVVGKPEINYIPTGSYEIDGNKLYLNVSENQQFIFTIYENSLIFESGEWLENWVEQGVVFQLSNDLPIPDSVISNSDKYNTNSNPVRNFANNSTGTAENPNEKENKNLPNHDVGSIYASKDTVNEVKANLAEQDIKNWFSDYGDYVLDFNRLIPIHLFSITDEKTSPATMIETLVLNSYRVPVTDKQGNVLSVAELWLTQSGKWTIAVNYVGNNLDFFEELQKAEQYITQDSFLYYIDNNHYRGILVTSQGNETFIPFTIYSDNYYYTPQNVKDIMPDIIKDLTTNREDMDG